MKDGTIGSVGYGELVWWVIVVVGSFSWGAAGRVVEEHEGACEAEEGVLQLSITAALFLSFYCYPTDRLHFWTQIFAGKHFVRYIAIRPSDQCMLEAPQNGSTSITKDSLLA
jgi:hypothetical protein